MIGLLLVTHGNIGRELSSALEHVLGPQEHLVNVSVNASDSITQKRLEIDAAIAELTKAPNTTGVLILTDMIGGTPSNLASRAICAEDVRALSGVNLPMLVTIAKARERSSLTHVTKKGVDCGRKFVIELSPQEPSQKGVSDG